MTGRRAVYNTCLHACCFVHYPIIPYYPKLLKPPILLLGKITLQKKGLNAFAGFCFEYDWALSKIVPSRSIGGQGTSRYSEWLELDRWPGVLRHYLMMVRSRSEVSKNSMVSVQRFKDYQRMCARVPVLYTFASRQAMPSNGECVLI